MTPQEVRSALYQDKRLQEAYMRSAGSDIALLAAAKRWLVSDRALNALGSEGEDKPKACK